MNIRPRNIPKFQTGGVPQWYLDRYGNRTALLGWDLNQRYNYANDNLMTNDHRNAGNLDTVYRKNVAYTGTPGAISSDIQTFYDSDGNGMSAEDFVNFYNQNAAEIRKHWALDLTYNKNTAGRHNRLFRKMFRSRSDMSQSPGSDYNIGYLLGQTKSGYDIQDIEGSSTWLRRMDLYENEFDVNNPDSNRLHQIKLKDGTIATFYKKANGDIGLLKNQSQQQAIDGVNVGNEVTITGTDKSKQSQIPAAGGNKYGFDWNKLKEGALKLFSNPDLWASARLAGNLINNNRVYDELLKGITPDLRLTYYTHRQVVGDEATKLGFYRRAVLGQTKAALPFTSDADRLMAYLYEAKRIGDELRAQGDLADNQEIRRTSDESNQHQWANTQRATEVANANIASINLANALRHNLLALKHSAQWSSIDNYLKEIEYRKRLKNAEQLAFDDLIFALLLQLALIDDPRIINAKKEFLNILDKHKLSDGTYDTKSDEVIAAQRKYLAIRNQILIELYQKKKAYYQNRGSVFSAKSGTKVTYKKKDDLLYKSTKDVVEHFRKMSKISSDALNRKKSKIEKLTSHPKGKTKKYLYGGVAPFTVYTPVALGGETTTNSEQNTSNTLNKNTTAKDTLDMVKKMFEAVLNTGLPIDVNIIYRDINNLFQKAKLFGEELSTDDIASIYLQSMLKISNLKYSKENYDKALAVATSNESLNEFAVDASGNYVVQDKEGKLSIVKSLQEAREKKLNPVTNLELLNLRAYSPDLAFARGDYMITNIINNGMGINKIGALIKALAGSLGSTEGKLEGISQVESGKVKAGLLILAGTAGTPDGHYGTTNYTKDLLSLVQAALKYIENMLSPSLKAILEAHGGTKLNIALFLTSQQDYVNEQIISPLTGKASDKGLGSGGTGDISSNPLLAILREVGGVYLNYSLVTKNSNTKLSVNGTFYSLLPKISEDMSMDKMLSTSGIGGIIQGKRGITFGNLEINPEDLKHIMYSNNGGMVVTLPCKIVNGIKLVNLDVVETYEKAEQKALQINSDKNSPQFIQALALELKNEHLDSLLDSNGLPNKNMFGQFLVVEAYTSDKVKFDTNSKYIEKINNPDEELELRISKALSTDNKKSDYTLDVKDHWTIFEGSWDDIYKGTVFIPLNNNPNAALNTWGNSAKIGQTTELEELYLISNKSSKFNSNNTLE